MRWVKYYAGAFWWYVCAGTWYLTLGFRLYFAFGLDQNFKGDREAQIKNMFTYKRPRAYRRHLDDRLGGE